MCASIHVRPLCNYIEKIANSFKTKLRDMTNYLTISKYINLSQKLTTTLATGVLSFFNTKVLHAWVWPPYAKVFTFSRPRYVRIVRKERIAMRMLAQNSSDCFDRNTELLYNPSNSFTLNLTFSACGRNTHSRSRHLSRQPPFFVAPGKSGGCGVAGD